VLAAGVACGHDGPAAIAQAAAGWDQELLAAHGCRVCPRTGRRVAPSASTLDRLPRLLDADGLEAGLSGCLAAAALGPRVPVLAAAQRQEGKRARDEKRKKRKPPAAAALREVRDDGWFRAAPGHPWLDPAAAGDPGHVPARQGLGVDGKERKLAKAGGKRKVHLLAAVTHVPGIVIAQGRVAKSGKANEVTHFRPLLESLPLEGAAATAETGHGRIETRTVRVLPVPAGTGFEDAAQAILIERYTTYKKNGQWRTRCEAVFYITSLTAEDAAPRDLLAFIRGHWRIEHAHWLRDVIWNEDKSLIRTGNAPQVMSALANLIISPASGRDEPSPRRATGTWPPSPARPPSRPARPPPAKAPATGGWPAAAANPKPRSRSATPS